MQAKVLRSAGPPWRVAARREHVMRHSSDANQTAGMPPRSQDQRRRRTGPCQRPRRLLIPHALPSLHNGRRRGHSCDSRASQPQPPVATEPASGASTARTSVRSLHGIPCDIRSARVRGVLSEVFAAIQRQPRDLARLCRILQAGISSPVETVKQRDGGRLGRRQWLRDSTPWRAWPESGARVRCARGSGSSSRATNVRVAPG